MTTSFAPRFLRVLALLATGLALLAGLASAPARAQQPASAEAARDDYLLGPGDAIRIQVFQNPDLTVEARVSEAGVISFPLLGALRQAANNADDGELPVVIWRPNGLGAAGVGDWVVAMTFDNFIDVLRRLA